MHSRNSLYALALVMLSFAAIMVPLSKYIAPAQAHKMATFSSCQDLERFLAAKPPGDSQSGTITPLDSSRSSPTTLSTAFSAGTDSTPAYSETNVQVDGVDEADTVKSDGTYLYEAVQNQVLIMKAYPATDAAILTRLIFNGSITGIFVNNDKLVVIQGQGYYGYASVRSYPIYWSPGTRVSVYGIADKTKPSLEHSLQLNGTYVSSRLITGHVYIVTSQPSIMPMIYTDIASFSKPSLYSPTSSSTTPSVCDAPSKTLPHIITDGEDRVVNPTEIYHPDLPDYSHSFTQIASISLLSDATLRVETFLVGGSGALYASSSNLYLTQALYSEDKTSVHRIKLRDGEVTYQASGEVQGRLLNQFSMDEYQGYLRVATTTWRYSAVGATGSPMGRPAIMPVPTSSQSTGVYALDMNLRVVGSVTGLGEQETFHSARFLGARAYLVTFKQVDPLFVVDLSNPSKLRVLGELKVSGFSDYLHPYDQTHLIGVGMETGFYRAVKISLFDVSDPAQPSELGKFEGGSYTPALYEHKAFLFDRARNLLVLPINSYETTSGNPSSMSSFQGAYVFDISIDRGIVFRGRITHFADGPSTGTYPYAYDRSVSRALYIGNILYTISHSMVKMNSLSNLAELNSVEIPPIPPPAFCVQPAGGYSLCP